MLKNNQIIIFRSYTSFVALLCMALSSINCSANLLQPPQRKKAEVNLIKTFKDIFKANNIPLRTHASIYDNLPLQFLFLMPNLNATPALFMLLIIAGISIHDCYLNCRKKHRIYSLCMILALLTWVAVSSNAVAQSQKFRLFAAFCNLYLVLVLNLGKMEEEIKKMESGDQENMRYEGCIKSIINVRSTVLLCIIMYFGFCQWMYGFLPPSFTSFVLAPYFCMLILQLVIGYISGAVPVPRYEDWATGLILTPAAHIAYFLLLSDKK